MLNQTAQRRYVLSLLFLVPGVPRHRPDHHFRGMTALSGLATGYASLIGYRIGVAIGEAGSVPAIH